MTNAIASYRDLDVYKNASSASKLVVEQLIPKLPRQKDGAQATQLARCTRAVAHFIAKGNLGAAMAKTGQTVMSLADIHKLSFQHYQDKKLCLELLDQYDKVGRQLFKLSRARKNKKAETKPATAA